MFRVMRALSAGVQAEEPKFEDPGAALAFLMAAEELLLKAGEYEAFERLLYALNYVEQPHLLISLAAMYHACGFYEMAAETVLRSIRELNEITPEGAQMLAEYYR